MKRLLLAICLILTCGIAQADCVATILDVKTDLMRGSIMVQTQYVLNGTTIMFGHGKTPYGTTRYTEDSAATMAELKTKIAQDVKSHCEALIQRIDTNSSFIKSAMVTQQTALTQPIIDSIKSQLIGQQASYNGITLTYKGKDINVTSDSVNTVTDTVE